MNRYDTTSVAKFNPMSYQEIMAAPLAMRQKHDNAILAAEAMRLKPDPHSKHYSRALELKQQMDNEIANNVDTLNKEGYNSTTFQNITKLNRQYQDLISPTGEIGQINAAKTVYDTNQEEFIKDAAKQNIGRDRAINLWKEKTNYYTGFGEDGKSITNVSPQGVAAYQDYTKDKQVAHSILGKTVQGVSSQGHHLEVDKQTGGVWEITRNGKRVKSDNTRQVEAALRSTLDKWDNPNGEGKKWLMDSGDGLNRDRIINDFNSMLERSDINDVSENANYNAPSTGGDGSGTPGSMLTDVMTESGTKDKSYGQVLSEIGRLNQLKSKNGSLTSSEQIDLEKYNSQIKGASGALTYASKYDKEYIDAKKDYDNAFIEFNKKIPASLKTPWINEAKDAKTKLDRILSSAKRLGYSTQDLSNIESAYHKSLKTGEKYFNKRQQIFSKSNDYYTSYTNVPVSPDSKKEYDALNETLLSVLKNSSSANGNNIIYSVKDENGKFKPLGGNTGRESEDYDGIVGLLGNSKNVKIVDFSDVYDTGIPTMTIEADMGDSESTYDLAGVGSGSKNIGGKGNKVTFKVNMNNLRTSHDGSATVDPGNFSSKFIRYLYNQGGKNKELAESMLANITKHQADKNK